VAVKAVVVDLGGVLEKVNDDSSCGRATAEAAQSGLMRQE
jgi:hypothetical protein